MDTRFENAKRYFYVILRDVMLASGDQFYSGEVVEEWVLARFPNVLSGATTVRNTRIFTKICLNDFIRRDWLDAVDDDFASVFVRKNDRLIKAPNEDGYFFTIQEKYSSFGPSSDTWLGTALQSIANRFEGQELIEHLITVSSEDNETLKGAVSDSTESESWSPLAIDRSDTAYLEAVEASEAALREIEASNGYASSEPDERNAIVSTVRGNLEAIKSGFPSRQAIFHGLVKPIEYVAKKFPDAAIGAVAKIAVTKLLAWLATLFGG